MGSDIAPPRHPGQARTSARGGRREPAARVAAPRAARVAPGEDGACRAHARDLAEQGDLEGALARRAERRPLEADEGLALRVLRLVEGLLGAEEQRGAAPGVAPTAAQPGEFRRRRDP